MKKPPGLSNLYQAAN